MVQLTGKKQKIENTSNLRRSQGKETEKIGNMTCNWENSTNLNDK